LFMMQITGKVLRFGRADPALRDQDAQQRVPTALHLYCL
jgi:hypothetical protein